MLQKSSTILAVDPGSRELGVAVLGKGGELLFYGVKTVTSRKNPILVLETVIGYIRASLEKFRPDVLAIEKMFITQKNSALLAVVAEQIKVVARGANLEIREYAPTAIRKRLCRSGRATKREAARVLTTRYPELERFYVRTRAWERDYYANMFDAVAVGAVCLDELINESGETA
jgi:Holliday junction resolvasome RuvABC endonuclease subunit